jgi:hypothetical protein
MTIKNTLRPPSLSVAEHRDTTLDFINFRVQETYTCVMMGADLIIFLLHQTQVSIKINKLKRKVKTFILDSDHLSGLYHGWKR